jgi:KaiC/GvpD/RAD55 family RecA-like ATPase
VAVAVAKAEDASSVSYSTLRPTPADMVKEVNRLVGHNEIAMAGIDNSAIDEGQALLMPSCIYTTGFKHAMHNCNKDLNTNLLSWDTWKIVFLAPVVKFLRYQPWRERLEVTCLKGTTMEGMLKELPYDILEWRWGSTHDVCDCLLRLEGLRETWDIDKYMYAEEVGHTPVIAKTIHNVETKRSNQFGTGSSCALWCLSAQLSTTYLNGWVDVLAMTQMSLPCGNS